MPGWPDPARPQQVHLDLAFDDEGKARDRAVRLGAIALPFMGGGNVYADPAGHPFCLGDGDGTADSSAPDPHGGTGAAAG